MIKQGDLLNPQDENIGNSCASCLNYLEDEEYVSALGQEWHTECFRCSACDAELSSWYFEKEGMLFCKDDYYASFGEACQQCGQVITGPVMVAGEHRFHPECFCCTFCNAFIGDGDSYALVERSKLFCGQCYKRQMQPLQRSAKYPFSRKPHSIRLVEIPGGQKGIKLSEEVLNSSNKQCFMISELDKNNDLMSLHVGDKILEINGTPLNDTPLEKVENLLRYSDSLLQLTIEHDPETISLRFPTKIVHSEFPLSMTASDTNIPSKKSSIPLEIETNCTGSNLDKNKQGTKAESNKERLFKKRDEGYMSGLRSRHLKKKNKSNDSGQSLDKERSSSMSRLLDDSSSSKKGMELSRACSFLEKKPQQRVFRASDLVKGELLGQGFFGQVYKVTTKDTDEVMVLKELYRVDEEAQKNFLKEVAVLRNLHHNNVLRFIGVLYKERRLHLVTEYISGGTLTEIIHDVSQPLPWEQRISFAKDIAAGMAYLHSMNIIHRDLNSHNCLVRDDKTVIVADFGLARILAHPTDSIGRKAGQAKSRQERRKRYTVVGNPYWMAPEMMKGNKYDEKVDIFSFGIVLCEIIGRVQADPDFLPRSNDFGLNQIVFREKFCSSCPEPFYKVAFLCTDLNPDKRPPFEVMEVWLESLLMHLSVGTALPPDLLFDIYHYRGLSPSSSGSTTPEGIPSGHRSPALQPICEGKMLPHDTQAKKSQSAENLKIPNFNRPLKMSSSDSLGSNDEFSSNDKLYVKSCEDIGQHKYIKRKNLDKLNQGNSSEDFNKNLDKPDCIEVPKISLNLPENVVILKLPAKKNLGKSDGDTLAHKNNTLKTEISLNSIKMPLNSSLKTTNKYLNLSKSPVQCKIKDGRNFKRSISCESSDSNIPDIVFSTLRKPTESEDLPSTSKSEHSKTPSCSTFSISRDIFKKLDQKNKAGSLEDDRKFSKLEPQARNFKDKPAAEQRKIKKDVFANLSLKTNAENKSDNLKCDILEPTGFNKSSNSLVKSIVNSLNRKDKEPLKLGNRFSYGRSSLKITGSPKINLKSSKEFSAL